MAQRVATHPGEVLLEEFMVPLGLSARELARQLRVPANRISEICRGGRSITAETALMLARLFGTTPHFWINLQANHDLTAAMARSDFSHIKPLKRSA